MWQRVLLHASLFSISKVAVLISPFFAAYLLSIDDYGELERALATASLLAVFLSMGMPAVIAYAIVKQASWTRVVSALRYLILLLAVFLLMSCVGAFLFASQLSFSLLLVVSMLGLFVGQSGLAAYMKASGMGAYASVVESSLYLGLLLFLCFLWIAPNRYDWVVAFYTLLSAVVLLAFILLQSKVKQRLQRVQYDLNGALKAGFPMMLAGSMSMLMLFFPRLFLGYFSSLSELAEFSLLFRLAAIAIVVHQFIVTLFFKDIFQMEFETLSRVLLWVPLAVLFAVLLGFGVLHLLVMQSVFDLGAYSALSDSVLRQVVIAFCLFFWSLTALLEGVLFRDEQAKQQLFAVVLGLSAMLVFTFLLLTWGEMDQIVMVLWAWLLGLVVAVGRQIRALERLGKTAKSVRCLKWFSPVALFILFVGVSLSDQISAV
ncbi:MAG: oligosaccharide flippase family protein [Gammaproteobacteria bacterium]|nr:oligosaccharide flippase family protein [Gammaproteobacteria bacterium]